MTGATENQESPRAIGSNRKGGRRFPTSEAASTTAGTAFKGTEKSMRTNAGCVTPPTPAASARARGSVVLKAVVTVNGKQVVVRSGDRLRSRVDLRNLPNGHFKVAVVLTLRDGRKVQGNRK
jgi:hypothetical protein